MEVIGHILLALFVALILFTAITFGFVLLAWFVGFAIAVSVLLMLRGWIRRWWFLYVSRDRHARKPPKTIDGDWRDISDNK
jgi:hypothetical protein